MILPRVALVLLLAGCSTPPREASLEDDFAPLLDDARSTRQALESAEAYISAEMPEPSRRAAWSSVLTDLRGALRAARDRETNLAMLVE